ncbi:MAG: CHAT domain-containing protein [Leptolyngbya sp. SIO3F4]|nr:CHAT domain-containing protein [Leptolyngbya sp. SIO3F4]
MNIFEVEIKRPKLNLLSTLITTFLLVDCYIPISAFADSIVSSEGGTGSVVTTEDNQHTITGGSHSSDGNNLFHEFEHFNLPTNEVADFLVTPELNNILTLINGGSVSSIDGLVQVTGGDANLFLVNPAGVLLGKNAALNLGGGLTITTADQIGFGEHYLSLFDTNDYTSLVGTPNAFAFTANTAGVIVNEGNLALSAGQPLTIIGGTVINTGHLSTEDGIVTIAAVPGEQLVRISQAGSLLNLEVAPISDLTAFEPGTVIPFNPVSLPESLTGGSVERVSELAMNPDGTVQLTAGEIAVDPGTTLVSGDITTLGDTGGAITVLGDQVGLVGASLDASGTRGGGTMRIGGDYQGQGIANASRTLVSADSSISADALLNGDGGQIIVWADEITRFYGELSARGGSNYGNGGFAEISGKDSLVFNGSVDLQAPQGNDGTLLFDPANIEIRNGSGAGTDDLLLPDLSRDEGIGDPFVIFETTLEELAGNVTLAATNNITIQNLDDDDLSFSAKFGESVTIKANGAVAVDDTQDIISTKGGNLTIEGDSLRLGGINIITENGESGGNLTLRGNEIDLLGEEGSIQTRDDSSSSCCRISIAPPDNSPTEVLLGGGIADTGIDVLDLTADELNAFSSSPFSAVYDIGSNSNLTIPGTPTDLALAFNRNLSLNASGILSIERPLEVNGPIWLRADEINLLGGDNSVRALPSLILENSELVERNTFSTIRLSTIRNASGAISDIVVAGDPNIDNEGILDLTEQDLAALDPARNIITIGRLDNRSDFQVGNITVDAFDTTPLAFNDRRIVQFQTNTGNVQINRPIDISNNGDNNVLTIEAANVELGELITAENIEFRPSADEISIGLGDGAVGDFQLDTAELTDNLDVTGTVTVGRNVLNAPSDADFGAVQLSNLAILDNEDYSLTIRGGNISFAGGSVSNEPTIQLADNETLALISSENIVEGARTDIRIDGANGSLLLDAADGIGSGQGGLDVSVANLAARTRNTGDIRLTLRVADINPAVTPTISSVTYNQPLGGPPVESVGGLVTAENGRIFLEGFNETDGSIVINEPIQAGGAGNVEIGNLRDAAGIPTLFLNSEVSSDSGDITFSAPIILGNGGGQIMTQGGNINFEERVEGSQILRLNAADGNVQFDGPLGLDESGSPAPLNGVIVEAGNVVAQSTIDVGAGGFLITATGTTILADDVTTTGNLNVVTDSISAADISTQNASGNSGSVTIEAITAIQTGAINTSSLSGDAGDVLLDPISDIAVASINATAPSGTGGTVDITTERFFRASESFIDFNSVDASISTAGAFGNSPITIRHGGRGFVPFTIGDASLNGTQAAITTGENTTLPTQTFFDTYIQGDIQIITDSQQEPIIDNVIDDLTNINDDTDIFIGLAPATEPAFVTVTYDNTDVIESVLRGVEDSFQQQYENYYQASLLPDVSGENGENESIVIDAQNTIRRIEDTTGAKPAIIYAFFAPSDKIISEQARIEDIRVDEAEPQSAYPSETLWTFKSEGSLSTLLAQLQRQEGCKGREDDQLFLVVVTSNEKVISKHVPSATCEEVTETASSFRETIFEQSQNYLLPSQQLYGWLINPLVRDLERNNIDNLVFIMDQGLRATPLAALHNGKNFLVENYSLGLMPSLNLTDTRYQNIQDSLVLPAGMSNFPDQNLDDLPAVPFEIDSVINNWFGSSTPLLEEAATTNNIRNSRNAAPTGIVHLATHARFNRSSPDKSYIQLWDRKLRLSEVRKMGWHDPVLELLILSACETASDSYEAELGFAGFASQAGVKSTLASLWNVSDVGTAALMIEFYTQLRSIDVPIKAEALQEAQVAMLNGEVFLKADTLYWSGGDVALPDSIHTVFHREETVPNLSHPFYWSGFTLVGSPW